MRTLKINCLKNYTLNYDTEYFFSPTSKFMNAICYAKNDSTSCVYEKKKRVRTTDRLSAKIKQEEEKSRGQFLLQ